MINDTDTWLKYSSHYLKVRVQFDGKFMVDCIESELANTLDS
jgi:hypothetical protein